MRGIRSFVLLASLAGLAGLPAGGLAQAAPVKVVASFSILGDFVREVGGDRVALTVIAGPGQDAHVYEPRPADVAAVSSADLVVVNGLHFEGFLERLIKAGAGKAPVAVLSDGAELLPADGEHSHDHGHSHDHDHDHDYAHDHGAGTHYNPHAWQAVPNAMVYVRNLAQALCKVDAPACDDYRARAQAYTARLRELDAELRESLGGLPPEGRTILTAHQAFRYFGHAYGLSFLSPTGLSTDAEATAADMRRLVQQLRQQQVAAIFLEQNANPRLVRRLATETGLSVSGTLYADTLSAPGGEADTYLDMMRHNGSSIANAVRRKLAGETGQ